MPYYKGVWYSEQGVKFDESEDKEIETMLEFKETEIAEIIGKKTEEEVRNLLAKAFRQIGSIQLDGTLYTNLIDEFKRGASGPDVLKRAEEWEMWSTELAEEEGGFPRSEGEETSGETFLKAMRQAPKSLVSKILTWLSAGLRTILSRLTKMLRVVIPLLKRLKLSVGLSGISVNAGLPPSVSFNFDIQGIPAIPLTQFMQSMGTTVPAGIP